MIRGHSSMAITRVRMSSSAYPTSILSLSGTAFLLAALLPTSSLAQETPTTFATSTSPSTSTTPATSIASSATGSIVPTNTASSTVPTSSTSTNGDQNGNQMHVFNNYWSFIIVIVVLLILSVSLYTLRRRKKRMLLAHQYRARGISDSEDVGGIRSPRYGLGWGWPADGDRTTPPPGVATRGRRNRGGQQIEGLNERGEAPPPYSGVGSKPPSLRSDDGYSGRCPSRAESARTVNRRRSDDVELGDMTRPTYEPYVPPRNSWTPRPPPGAPPGYNGDPSSSGTRRSGDGDMGIIARPDPAVTRP